MLATSSVPAEFVPPGAIVDAASGRRARAGGGRRRPARSSRRSGSPERRSDRSRPWSPTVFARWSSRAASRRAPSARATGSTCTRRTAAGGRTPSSWRASSRWCGSSSDDAATGAGIGGTPAGDPGAAVVLLVDGDAAARLAYARAFGQLLIAIMGPRALAVTDGIGTRTPRRMPGRTPPGGVAWRRPSTERTPLTVLQAIVLGLTQGVTEFAPVSSSGHLILVPWLFGWSIVDDVALNKTFDVALHMGTLLGAIIYFRADLVRYLRAWFASVRAPSDPGSGSASRVGARAGHDPRRRDRCGPRGADPGTPRRSRG